MPKIDNGNVDIWRLLTSMDSQWLCSVGGIYGINMAPIIEAARDLEINIDWVFLRKVKVFETEAIKIISGKAGGCTEEKKAICREMFGDNLTWACEYCEEKKVET